MFERNMASFTRQSPILQGDELYMEWKCDIEIWSLFTDLMEEKQGPEVFLSLPQNIRDCVQHLAITDIGRIDVLWVIMDKLNEIYLHDKHTMAYMAFEDFCFYSRTAGLNINNFLARYKFLCKKLCKFGNYLSRRSSVLYCFEHGEYIRRKQKCLWEWYAYL